MASAAEDSLFASILINLENLTIPYFVVGGVAALLYGTSRVTYDIDIVVDLEIAHIQPLTQKYPLPRYYADPIQIQDALIQSIQFNIIDTQTGQKADLIPKAERHTQPFIRRVRQTLTLPGGAQIPLWVASPEDVIIGKLQAWNETPSLKHESDIVGILVANNKRRKLLDISYITEAVQQLNDETLSLWHELLKNAEDYS